jgi:hypothetical protein
MPELGAKHECHHCGAKFYDLGKPEPLCPRCGTNAKTAASAAVRPVIEAPMKRKRREEIVRRQHEDLDEATVVPEEEDEVEDLEIDEEDLPRAPAEPEADDEDEDE